MSDLSTYAIGSGSDLLPQPNLQDDLPNGSNALLGELGKDHVLQGIAEFDALAATKRMRLHSLLSTIAAAISALASAVAAYFAYLGAHHQRIKRMGRRTIMCMLLIPALAVIWNMLG